MLRKKYKKDICIYRDINQENNTGSRKISIFYFILATYENSYLLIADIKSWQRAFIWEN